MPLSLLSGETAYQPIITGIFFGNVTKIKYYKLDYNTMCHKHCIKIHSLVYRLEYCEAILSIALGYY